MKYYVTVDLKRSTTKLGLKLAELVARELHAALLTKEQADAIPDWLAGVIEQLCVKNKRFTPMEVRTNGYETVDGSKCLICDGANAQIYTVTATGAKAFEDNRPFTMYLHPVFKDLTAGEFETPSAESTEKAAEEYAVKNFVTDADHIQ